MFVEIHVNIIYILPRQNIMSSLDYPVSNINKLYHLLIFPASIDSFLSQEISNILLCNTQTFGQVSIGYMIFLSE